MKRLTKENQKLQEEYNRLLRVFEEKEERESVKTGIPLEQLRKGFLIKTERGGKDGLKRAPHPPKDVEALANPGEGNPSLSRPPIGGETLGGKRGQKASLPSENGEALNPQTGEEMEVEILLERMERR